LNKRDKWYNEIESTVCVIIMLFMLIILSYQVGARYIFGNSYAWIDELSRYSLIWFAYLAACYAIIHNAHIKIDLLLKVWPKAIRKKIKLFSNVVFFVYCVVVAYYSFLWIQGVASAGTISMGTGMSVAKVSAIIPISHLLMAIRLIQLEIRLIRNPELLLDIDEAEAALEQSRVKEVCEQ